MRLGIRRQVETPSEIGRASASPEPEGETWREALLRGEAYAAFRGARMRKAIVLAIVCFAALFFFLTGVVAFGIYHASISQLRRSLAGIAESDARLLELEASAQGLAEPVESPFDLADGELSLVTYRFLAEWGFGETGEIVIGGREGDSILLLHSRGLEGSEPGQWKVVEELNRAEPLTRALAGESGTMIGRDYRGQKVLAAYRWIDSLGLGLVVKQDISEVVAPYRRAAAHGGLSFFMVVLCASYLVLRFAYTTQKEAEKQTRRLKAEVEDRWRAEDSLAALLDSLPIGVVVSDELGRIVKANRGGEDLFGLSETELLGTSIESWVPGCLRRALLQHRDDLHSRTAPLLDAGRGEAVLAVRSDGSVRQVEIGMASMITGDGYFYVATLLDLSGRRRAEEALQLTQVTMDNAADAIFWVQPGGDLSYANLAAQRLVGCDPLQLSSMSLWDIDCELSHDGWDALWQQMCIEGTVTLDTSFRILGGGEVPVEVRAKHVKHGARELAVAFVRDVTAHKEYELRLVGARQTAEEASQAKSAFLANMSHEIRTPLNAVLGFTQILLRDATLATKHRETVRRISKSGEHLLGLIQDILLVSRIEAGRVELKPEVFELHGLLEDIEGLFVVSASEKGLELEVVIEPGVPSCVEADKGKILQIIMNLVGNAIKYTESGRITVRAAIDPDTSGSGSARPSASCGASRSSLPQKGIILTVEDTGPGISPDEQELVFEQFERSKQAGLSKGAGLGLTICKEYISLLGGRIELESKLGAGSTFRCFIPVLQAREMPAPVDESGIFAWVEQNAGVGARRPARALVVDDVETNRDLLQQILEILGFETRQVCDGEAAVAAAERWEPEIIFMDLLMPGISGIEAIQRIRSLSSCMGRAQPKILVVTAAAVEETIEQARAAGADAVLSKPLDEDAMCAEVARLIDLEVVYQRPTEQLLPKVLLGADAAMLMAGLPRDLIDELRSAAAAADLDHIEALMWKVEARSPELGTWLQQAMSRFDYPGILAATERTTGHMA